MAARSFIIQLQPGVGQAILPDHRKMLPGLQYVVDAETFGKISLGARQNIVKVVSVNLDNTGNASLTTSSGTFVPAQVSSGLNTQAVASGVSWFSLLTTVGTSLSSFSLAGFSAQGYGAGGTQGTGTGIGTLNSTLSGNASNQTLVGPEGNRYALVYNGTNVAISGGWSTVWLDENNRYVTPSGATSYQVNADGLGTPYTISSNTSLPSTLGTNVTTVGTKQGAFAGISLVNIPAGNFGWVMIEGTHPNVAVPSGTAVGSTVAVGSGTGANLGVSRTVSPTATSVSTAGVVTGSALANNVFGTVLTAAVSGTSTNQWFAAVEVRSRRVKKPYVRVLNKN